jgi:hypothetical protein
MQWMSSAKTDFMHSILVMIFSKLHPRPVEEKEKKEGYTGLELNGLSLKV